MPPNRRLSGFVTEKTSLLGLFSLPEVFCGPQICQKMRWRQGTSLGELTTLPRPPSRLGEGDTPFPIHTPLGAFGALICAPM